jgi:hypothetical protein
VKPLVILLQHVMVSSRDRLKITIFMLISSQFQISKLKVQYLSLVYKVWLWATLHDKNVLKKNLGGILADGINGLLAALMTITPMSTFAQNNGVIALTRCANRKAGYFCWYVFTKLIELDIHIN